MSTFDPTKPAQIHDDLNDTIFTWDPAWADNYRQYAIYGAHGRGVVNWDGRLLDGWAPPM